ncbi:MAG: DUF3575 domain-containing protein [Bacteroidales bacterium]|nr:DUF3575 domain-containing protein [Bacteroidales bacterium]
MKKTMLILITIAAILANSSPVSAQASESEKDFRFTIKTNPLSALGGPFWLLVVPLTGEYKVLFEAAVGEKSSFQVGAGYLGPSVFLNLDELTANEGETGGVSGIKTSGFRVQGMYKYFLSRNLKAPNGFYVGPHASFANAQLISKDNSNDYIKATKININGVFGYQLITAGGFTLDIYTGLGFVSRKWDTSEEGTNWTDDLANKSTINVPFGFSFGYAF